MWMGRSLGILLKGRLCLTHIALSLTNLILHSIWDMFIRAGLVHGRSSWHVFCDHCLQWCKLSICVNSYNTKSLLSIVDVHLIEGGVDCLRFPVRKMVYRSKEMFSAKVKEERYCIHKEYAWLLCPWTFILRTRTDKNASSCTKLYYRTIMRTWTNYVQRR